jgi:small subunit ribosomal protein S4e
MARGPKKHLKRLNAPRSWMLSKMGGTWAPRPSPGPHKLRESLPLSLIIRNRLKYALTRREVVIVTARRLIRVDGKVRTDLNYPTGFMDIVSIDKTSENFRVLYDVKGRFVLHRVAPEEATYKLARVKSAQSAKKASIGRNPFKHGPEAAIPYIVTHDGRTIRYPDPIIKSNDTVKIDLKTNKIIGHLKFEVGNLCFVTRGANMGRIGVLVHTDKHPGSFDIVHLRDRRGNTFATRSHNVFVIGEGKKAWVSLPRDKGVKISIIEEREKALNEKKGGKKKKQTEDKDEEKVEKPTKGKETKSETKETTKETPAPTKEAGKQEKGKGGGGKQEKGKGGKGGGKQEKGGKGGKGGSKGEKDKGAKE